MNTLNALSQANQYYNIEVWKVASPKFVSFWCQSDPLYIYLTTLETGMSDYGKKVYPICPKLDKSGTFPDQNKLKSDPEKSWIYRIHDQSDPLWDPNLKSLDVVIPTWASLWWLARACRSYSFCVMSLSISRHTCMASRPEPHSVVPGLWRVYQGGQIWYPNWGILAPNRRAKMYWNWSWKLPDLPRLGADVTQFQCQIWHPCKLSKCMSSFKNWYTVLKNVKVIILMSIISVEK